MNTLHFIYPFITFNVSLPLHLKSHVWLVATILVSENLAQEK